MVKVKRKYIVLALMLVITIMLYIHVSQAISTKDLVGCWNGSSRMEQSLRIANVTGLWNNSVVIKNDAIRGDYWYLPNSINNGWDGNGTTRLNNAFSYINGTLCFWANYSGATADTYTYAFLGLAGTALANARFGWQVDKSPEGNIQIGMGGGWTSLGVVMPKNQWHLYCLWWNNSMYRVYINGTKVYDNGNKNAWSTTWWDGGQSWSGFGIMHEQSPWALGFNGSMDNFQIWNRSLEESEMSEMFTTNVDCTFSSDIVAPTVIIGSNTSTVKYGTNISIDINSTEPGDCWVYSNITWVNTTAMPCNATATFLVNSSRGSTIYFTGYGKDGANNIGNASYKLTVSNSLPTAVGAFNISSGWKSNSEVETVGWAAAIDYDGDIVNYVIYRNDSGPFVFYANITNNSVTMNFTAEKPYYYKIETADNYGTGPNSSVMQIIYDITAPTISWHSPIFATTDTTAESYLVNVTCTDLNMIWSMNISLLNYSGYQIKSVYNENVSAAVFNNWSYFNLTVNQWHRINVTCYDAHTDGPIPDLKKGKKGETVLLFNDSISGALMTIAAYFVEKADKLTDTPGDVLSSIDYVDKYGEIVTDASTATKIKWGTSFTVLKPETKIVYNLTSNRPMNYLPDTGISGHIIWFPYVTDFASANYVYVNGMLQPTITTVTVLSPYKISVKIQGLVQWQAGDIISIDPETQGLNRVSEEKLILQDNPPNYQDLMNNASDKTFINGIVNVSVNATDPVGLRTQQIFRHNSSGSWQEVTLTTTTEENQILSSLVTMTVPHAYVCANFSIYSAWIHINNTNYTCWSVQNSLPLIPTLLAPANESTEYTNITTFDWTDSSDPDSDTLHYGLILSNQSDFGYIIENVTNLTSSIYTYNKELTDGLYYWKVNASDGYASSNYSGYFQYIINTSFGIVTQQKNCTTCYYDRDILFNMSINGLGAKQTWFSSNFSGAWTNYSEYDSGVYNISLVYTFVVTAAGNFSNHEEIGWRWYVNHTLGNIFIGNLQEFTIANRKPSQDNPILNSSSGLNVSTDTLYCWPTNAADNDSDTLSYYYRWYKDAALMSDLNELTSISASNLSMGDVWVCQVTVADPYENGTTKNSTSLQIKDTIFPRYANLNNNASNSTFVNGQINFSVSLLDNKRLSYYIFSYNGSGVWSSDVAVYIGVNQSDISLLKYALTVGYLCGYFTFNDTSNNINTTTLSCYNSSIHFTEPTGNYLTFSNYSNRTIKLNYSFSYINKSVLTFIGYPTYNYSRIIPPNRNLSDQWESSLPGELMFDGNPATCAQLGTLPDSANATFNVSSGVEDYNLNLQLILSYNSTNLSIASCDKSNNKLRFFMFDTQSNQLTGNIWYCKNSSDGWMMLYNNTVPYYTGAEDLDGICDIRLLGNFKSYPSNINLTLNKQYQYSNYSVINDSQYTLASLNKVTINQILEQRCYCSGCNLSNYICYANLTVHSDTEGLLGYSISTTELFDITNCSTSSVPTNATSFNITFFDLLGNKVTVDYSSTMNYSLYSPNSITKNYSLALSSVDNVGYCIFPKWAILKVNQQNRYFDDTNYYDYFLYENEWDNITEQLYLYTQNGTTPVVLTVQDLNSEPVANAYIHVLAYNIGTGTYTTVEILKTDSSGQTIANLVLYNTYYNFLIYYGGILVHSEVGVRQVATTRIFTISLEGSAWVDKFSTTQGINHDLYYNAETDNFVFTYSDSSSEMHYGCMQVDKVNRSGHYTLSEQCVYSASGTIVYNIEPENGTTYKATTYVLFDDKFTLDSLEKIFLASEDLSSMEGQLMLFVTVLIIIILFMIGLPHPQVSLTLMGIGLIGTAIMRMWVYSGIVLGGIVFLIIFQMVLISRRS